MSFGYCPQGSFKKLPAQNSGYGHYFQVLFAAVDFCYKTKGKAEIWRDGRIIEVVDKDTDTEKPEPNGEFVDNKQTGVQPCPSTISI